MVVMLKRTESVAVNKKLELDPLTLKDLEAIKLAKKMKINFFALSFCSNSKDVNKLRSLVEKNVILFLKLKIKRV